MRLGGPRSDLHGALERLERARVIVPVPVRQAELHARAWDRRDRASTAASSWLTEAGVAACASLRSCARARRHCREPSDEQAEPTVRGGSSAQLH